MTASKPPFWSRPIAPLLMGVGACAACCAAPIAAIVIGAGAATTLAAVLEPLAGVLIGLAAVMAVVVYVRRRRARAAAACATEGACSIDRSCGCGPSPADRARAVGCTLEESAMPKRLDAFRDLFRRELKARTATTGRAVWTFAWSPALETEARALAAAEQGCCSFFEFDIERRGDDLRWITTAPPPQHDAVALLDGIAATVVPSSARA